MQKDDLENFAGGTPPNNWVVDRVRFNANITSRNMWESYLPTFESCLKEGRAASVMCSFNPINGARSPFLCEASWARFSLLVSLIGRLACRQASRRAQMAS